MKVKDIERTANVAWSPKCHHPIYLAAGTAAQQLDASFSTNAALEIYSLNLSEPGPDTKLVSSVPSDQRFHKIIWGPHGRDEAGTIITGCDGGLVQIYSASKLLKGEHGIIGKQEKHVGPVHAMDFNNFQDNLFATGAGESEIFIWDLNNTSSPMSPGTKSQPTEDVLSVAWNKQVQHILASTFPSKCVIWDLRKNEPIIKLTDTVSRIRWKVVAWHPEVATQLCLASEEDHSPIIQVWDLRFATSPLKTLENHQRGVLSISWCAEDSDLLVSCGKDNRILCWDPNSNQQNGEVLAEVAKTNQWSFDVAWCPRNPALIASPNFEGHISVYSVMGGRTQQIQTTDKIADSFPGMDGYVQAQAPAPRPSLGTESADLSKPPKWLKRPVGGSFGFGGRLVTFENDKTALSQAVSDVQPVPVPRTVRVSQVVTEPDLVRKSSELEKALECGDFGDYCRSKSEQTNDQHKKYIWHFIKANFEVSPRAELLNLLGYSIEDVNNKLNKYIPRDLHSDVDGLADDLKNINRIDDASFNDPFESLVSQDGKKTELFKINTSDDNVGLITQALLLNNVEAAVGLCLKAKRFADALIIATTGGADLLARTQHKYLEQAEGYVSSLIAAIVSEDWGSIINNCEIGSWKEAFAAILTHASDDDLPALCEQLGNRLEEESTIDPKYSQDAQLCYICAGSFDKLVASWSGNTAKSTDDLQELIELVTCLQKAVERQGRHVKISGAFADTLAHYASLLASQGDLSTALNYLGGSTDDRVVSLRNRLLVALGQKPLNVQEVRQQQSRRTSQRQSFSNYLASGGGFGNANQYQSVQQQPHAAFGQGQFGQQPWQPQFVPPPSAAASGFPTQPQRAFSPQQQPPPLSEPPRPTSVGSNQGTSTGLPSRKYLLDPSVSSNPYGSARTQIAPQPNNSFQHTPFNPMPINQNPPQQNPPLVPNNSFFSNPAPISGFDAPLLNPAGNAVTSSSSTGGYGVEASHGFAAPSGWNDPPPISSRVSKIQQKPAAPLADPITHPLYGTAPQSNGYPDPAHPAPPLHPYGGVARQDSTAAYAPSQAMGAGHNQVYAQPQTLGAVPNQMYAPPQALGAGPNQMYAPPQALGAGPNQFAQSVDPGGFNRNAVGGGNVAQQLQDVQGNVREATPQPVQKAPIPEEHLHMKTVLDELRHQCSCAANNPQTKRKLEDVGRKLETLYDSLREHKLSSNTLTSLHQMVQLIQNSDYTGGINLHTQLVSGPDFAQIASFMPGLKVLLQCAMQLQVYLR